MNHLAANQSSTSSIEGFDMKSFFFTDTYLFNKIKIGERSEATFETFFAILLSIVFSPIILLVSIAIKLTMGGDVLYSQVRVGKDGSHFRIYKFRSMVDDAEFMSGPMLATRNDPRVTSLGKLLRASHMDELPQLFNVILGEMSFVGPRPERPEFVEVFQNEIENYSRRHDVKPGITGLAQVCLSYDAKAQDKLEYDLFYIKNQNSILFNLTISYYTAMKMVTFLKNK